MIWLNTFLIRHTILWISFLFCIPFLFRQISDTVHKRLVWRRSRTIWVNQYLSESRVSFVPPHEVPRHNHVVCRCPLNLHEITSHKKLVKDTKWIRWLQTRLQDECRNTMDRLFRIWTFVLLRIHRWIYFHRKLSWYEELVIKLKTHWIETLRITKTFILPSIILSVIFSFFDFKQ